MIGYGSIDNWCEKYSTAIQSITTTTNITMHIQIVCIQ